MRHLVCRIIQCPLNNKDVLTLAYRVGLLTQCDVIYP